MPSKDVTHPDYQPSLLLGRPTNGTTEKTPCLARHLRLAQHTRRKRSRETEAAESLLQLNKKTCSETCGSIGDGNVDCDGGEGGA